MYLQKIQDVFGHIYLFFGQQFRTLCSNKAKVNLCLQTRVNTETASKDGSFTASSRFHKYTDKKIAQILSSHCICQAVSRLEKAKHKGN